jgi:phasin
LGNLGVVLNRGAARFRDLLDEEEKMANSYDVPTEMRDFADRSVSQARKAFETFMGAIRKTTGAGDSATSNPQLAAAKDVTGKAVSYAEKNVSAAFDLAEKLVHAKDVQEVMHLQTEYMRLQMEAIQSQMKEFGEVVQKASGLKPGETK